MKRHFRNLRLLAGSLVLYAALSASPAFGQVDPTISILYPADESTFLPGINFPVRVDASDRDGQVVRVDYFLNGIQAATTLEAPFSANLSLPSIGEFELTARAVDNDGREGMSEVVVVQSGEPDPTVPRVYIDFPLPLGGGDTVNDVSVASSTFLNARATDSDGTIESVNFYINGQLIGPATSNIGDTFARFFSPGAEGNYLITAEAIDNDGKSGFSVPLELDVGPLEIRLPEGQVLAPPAQIKVNEPILVFVRASGGLVEVNRVDLFANGVYVGSSEEVLVEDTYSIEWIPTLEGEVDLQARVVQVDPAGATWDNWLITEPTTVTVTQDSGVPGPSVDIFFPDEGVTYPTDTSVSVRSTGFDPNGVIRQVEMFINGGKVITYIWDTNHGWEVPGPLTSPYAIPSDNPPYKTDIQLLSPGDYLVQTRVISSTGVAAISDPVRISAKNLTADPEISILSPVSGSNFLPGTNLPVQVNAFDPGGLIEQIEFLINDVVVDVVTEAPFRSEISLPSSGTYVLTARSTTTTGAQAFSEEVLLTAGELDGERPRVNLNFPLPLGGGDTVNDVSVASAMFFNAEVEDPDGDAISDVRFYINGQLLGSFENNLGDVYSRFYQPNAQGNYVISAEAIDSDGNVGWSVPLLLDVGPLERQLPVAKMIRPFPESTVGREVGIFVEATGGLIQIDRVDFFADGVYLGSADEPVTENTFSFNWIPQVPGSYDLQTRIVQIDPEGATWDNWTISDSVPISITPSASGDQPTIEITNPDDETVSEVLRPIIVQASGLDPLGAIQEMRFYVNGDQTAADNQFPYGFTFQPQSPGLFQIVAEMVTDRGLLVHSDPVSVNVVTTLEPTGVIVSPSDDLIPTAGSTVPITIEAEDPDGYVESAEVFVNGLSIGVDNSAPFTVFWSPGSRGLYDIDVLLTDNSGNEVLISKTVTIGDPVGFVPRVTLSVTGSGNVTPGSRVVVLANVFDDTPEDLEVTFFQNGSQIGETDTEAPYSVIVDPESGFGPFGNAYSLTALATDPDGNSRADTLDPLYVSDFSVDQPSIDILNIEEGDNYTRGSRVPIRVEVGGGAARNLANLVFYADGVEIGRLSGGEPSGRYTFDWLPTKSGTVQVTAASLLNQEFYDHDRDSGSVDSTPRIPVTPVNVAFPVNINVNEPIGNLPSISLDTFPTNENLAIGSKVLVYADAQDLGGAVTQVEFFNDGVSVGVDTQAPFTHVLTTTNPGDFALNALATDSDGNVVTSTVVNLGIADRVITRTPEISLTVPDSGQEGNPLSLRASVEGFVNGPEAVIFFVNGQEVGESAEPPYSYSWLANLEGTLTFFATAQQPLSDGTLITTVSEIVDSFLVDNLPPVIGSFSFTYPNADDPAKPNPQLGDNLNFTVTMSDTGPIKSAELLRDGEPVQILQSPASPFQFTDFPPGVGQYQYSVVVTDRGSLQAQSQPLAVSVVERPGGGGPIDPDPNLPEIESFRSDPAGSSLVNLPIKLTVVATDEEGIEEVEVLQDGFLIGTATSEPYEVEFTPTAAGNYNFQARVTNLDGNQVLSDTLTINVRQPNPLQQNTDFVYQTFLDLLMRTPTLEERNAYTDRIESGDLSRDRFIRELIAPAEGDGTKEYDAVRGVLLANRFLLGSWPSREQLVTDVGTVSDGGLTALITSLMPIFEPIYVAEVGGGVSGVPDKISSDAEIDLYNRYLFGQKYGIVPTADQLELARLYFLSNGRDRFTTLFIQDVDVIPTGDSYFTADLGFEFAGDSPPSDSFMREADAASLLINLLRVVPSEEEVTALSQKLFAAQVSQILADPRYAARFQTAFRNLEHHANGWKYSDWFGWFNTAYEPWIYHADQGWISFTTVGQTEENFWYYDSIMGWNWTHGDMYPVLYNNKDGCWMMSIQIPDPVAGWRSFYNFDSGEALWIKR